MAASLAAGISGADKPPHVARYGRTRPEFQAPASGTGISDDASHDHAYPPRAGPATAGGDVTQNTYQHVMPKMIADATERVGGVLFAPDATTVAPPGRS